MRFYLLLQQRKLPDAKSGGFEDTYIRMAQEIFCRDGERRKLFIPRAENHIHCIILSWATSAIFAYAGGAQAGRRQSRV